MNDILDAVPLDSERWKTYDYLATKAVKDKAAGKGFARRKQAYRNFDNAGKDEV